MENKIKEVVEETKEMKLKIKELESTISDELEKYIAEATLQEALASGFVRFTFPVQQGFYRRFKCKI